MTAISANLQILLVFTCSSAPTRSSRRLLHSLSTKSPRFATDPKHSRPRSQRTPASLNDWKSSSSTACTTAITGGGATGFQGVSKMSDELSSRPHSNVSSVHPPHGLVEYIYIQNYDSSQ
ncbi:hypothetical protein TNCT_538601 [Trichonephila clavata]|uniref:Uncharacterized protein n=1 Tax=Trichonephila clavata TaxID=2740835 RepID=A0A8X6K6K7_TRICU|nr:hypothetical protein TNCT_538601 [Trichonephila clavata]